VTTSTQPATSRVGDDPERARDVLATMWRIRRFEEAVDDLFARGLMHGTMHLSIGQEGSATGTCLSLRTDDAITSTHRGHGHCIAKGASLERMMAELLGKESGYCRGRGGSMHIADTATGNLGANGIVAGGIPIATGAALAYKMQGLDRVVVSFFGDGATNEGAFHEALNLAAIWKLPVVFVCENNKYGMSHFRTRSRLRHAGRHGRRERRRSRRRSRHSRGSPSPSRRRPDFGRGRDLSLEGAQQERQKPLPHPRGDCRLAQARPDPALREPGG
jgi:TPP-dependent pyruvate/acetoin dehydrogenase alpha subunit